MILRQSANDLNLIEGKSNSQELIHNKHKIQFINK